MSTISSLIEKSGRGLTSIKMMFADPVRQLARFHGLDANEFEFNKVLNTIRLEKIKLELPNQPRLHFLIKRYRILTDLQEQLNAKFVYENESILVRFANLELEIDTEQDLSVINEIFILCVYNFHFPDNCVMVDIGMNVGFASLFFANNKKVEKVFSYEPFKPTFAQAQKNIKRNQYQSIKIEAYNFGLSGEEKTLEIDYSYEKNASVGINGMSEFYIGKVKTEKQIIEIKTITALFDIINAHNDTANIGIKMDCEGAEYEMIPQLVVNPNFSKVKFIMLEWHFKGGEANIEKLSSNGFCCFSFNPMNKETGLIYATRI